MSNLEKYLTMLQSEDASVRYEACEELRVRENLPKSALLALQKATNDNDPLVADAASRALHLHSEFAIAGQPTLSEKSIESERLNQAENDNVLNEDYYKQALAKQNYTDRKINKRKEPLIRLISLIYPIFWTIALAILPFYMITFLLLNFAFDDVYWLVIFFAIPIFFTGRYWYELIKNTMRINRDSAIAIATIIDKETRTSYHFQESGAGSSTTTYYLYLEFNPLQAKHQTGQITVSAKLHKGLWEGLDKGNKINIRYATEDPRVLLIEGEYL